MMRRMDPQEVYEELPAGELFLVDARGDTSFQTAREHIPGDLHYSLLDLTTLYRRIPRDRHIVAYCACVGDTTAERVARYLESKGFRADVLCGGLDGWKRAGLPTEALDAGIQHAA
jgi:rhodanese-related sulfurtransferase